MTSHKRIFGYEIYKKFDSAQRESEEIPKYFES